MNAGAVQSGRRGRGEVDGPGRFAVGSLVVRDGRLLLTGRWTGVRGMRFVRPTLVLEDRDVLATLEHKPWAVVTDADWVVAFPWAGDEPPPLDSAQLAVAPNLTVPLGAVEPASPASPQPAGAERAARLEREVDFLRGRRTEELGAARERLGATEEARDALRERLVIAEQRIVDLGARAAELTSAHHEAERRAADAEQRRAALDERAGAEVATLRRRLAAAEQRAAAAEQAAATPDVADGPPQPATSDVRAAEARADDLAARLASSERRVRELERRLAEQAAGDDRTAAAERRATAAEDLAGELSARLAAAERKAEALAAQARRPGPPPAALARRAPDDDEQPIGVRPVAPPLPLPAPVRRELLPGIDLWAQRILASAAALSLVLLLFGIVRLL